VPGQPASGAMVASSQVVNGWASGMAEGPRAVGAPAGTSRRRTRCATRAASTWAPG
jgi:hypothetical protein